MLYWRVDANELEPGFRKDVEDVLASPYDWYATYGYRSLELQADLYKKYLQGGPKAAPAGQSAHNFGLAIDIVLDASNAPGLQPNWDITRPEWQWLFKTLAAHPRLKSGVSFNDGGHIEKFNWRMYKSWANKA